jgi:vacuolar-type H+-ATPase subunit I/STV1
MNLPKLLEELKSGLDDLLLIDPNHLYADLLRDAIKAIESQCRTIVGLYGNREAFLREHKAEIEAQDALCKEVCGRYQAEIDRLNGLLAARTRGQTVIYHGGKYSAAELLDIVKAGEDRAKYLANLYDGAAAELCDCERKRAELDGVAEQYRIYRDRVDDLQRKIDRYEEEYKGLASQQDEAIANLADAKRQVESWTRALEIERDAHLESIAEVHCLRRQLRKKCEADAYLDALQPRSFFAMPGLDP